MEERKKEALVARFLELLEQSYRTVPEKWNACSLDEKIDTVEYLAFKQEDKIAAKALLEFTQSLNERMRLYPIIRLTRDYQEIIYCFYKDKVINEVDDLSNEIEGFGGQFIDVSPYLSSDEYIYISVGFVNQFLAWKFHREFRNGKYYSYTREYHKETEENMIIKAIKEGKFVWDYSNLYDLLHTSGFPISRGLYSDWYNLAAQLEAGVIDISVEECPIPEMPERNMDDPTYRNYGYALSIRGKAERGFLAYCAWYWLKQKGGGEIRFPTSLCNVSSEDLKIYVKVGDADPSQIMEYFLSRSDTYVHMLDFTTPTLLIFKPNEHYEAFNKGDKEIINRVKEAFNKIIEIEKEREIQRKKRIQLKNYNSCQLKNYDAGALFTTGQVGKILADDETSPLKGQYFSAEKIRSWITSGELKGFKNDKKWMVKKEDLIDFMNSNR